MRYDVRHIPLIQADSVRG